MGGVGHTCREFNMSPTEQCKGCCEINFFLWFCSAWDFEGISSVHSCEANIYMKPLQSLESEYTIHSVIWRSGIGIWSEWHYTTSDIGWTHNHDPVRASDYVSIHQIVSVAISYTHCVFDQVYYGWTITHVLSEHEQSWRIQNSPWVQIHICIRRNAFPRHQSLLRIQSCHLGPHCGWYGLFVLRTRHWYEQYPHHVTNTGWFRRNKLLYLVYLASRCLGMCGFIKNVVLKSKFTLHSATIFAFKTDKLLLFEHSYRLRECYFVIFLWSSRLYVRRI